jgi:FkbM family methyltransferase
MTQTMTKYSQQNEQIYILEGLKGIRTGKLLDIGAWHPCMFSNSRALIEMGWSALLIEPSPEPLVNLLKAYGESDKVQVLAAGVGVTRDIRPMHITADGLSTTEEREYEKWKQAAHFNGTLLVAMVTIDQLLSYGPFDFVDIDTEGTSVDLLKDLLFVIRELGIKPPRCLCVEHNERRQEVFRFSEGLYETVHQNDTNIILRSIG